MARRVGIYTVVALAACGAVGWAWHGSGAPAQGVTLLPRTPADPATMARPELLPGGSSLPASAMPSAEPNPRFRLVRVIVPPANAQGTALEALIAVDGQPPRSYRTGDAVVGAVVLQSVSPTRATLGPAGGPAAVVLEVDRSTLPGSLQPTVEGALPVVRAASAPAVDRSSVPVTDPDHGVDTSNH